LKVFIYYIGKKRDPHANAIADDFALRLGHYCATRMAEIRPDRFDPWVKHPNAQKILLDPAGKALDSPAFARWLEAAELRAADLVFLVAGADGPPADWRTRADTLLSLSAMTYPHELARAMLVEQVYRAFAVLRGHPYPRQ
jgi:23S rRNA (pseudouridine1915-N3)-methyltransferase